MQTVMLLGLLMCCAILFVVWLLMKGGWKYNHIPGPRFHWFPINEGSLAISQPDKSLTKIQELCDKHGDVIHVNVFGVNWVVISDYETVKLLMRDRESFPNDGTFRRALIRTMGRSMFASEGDSWKEKHSILLPLMSQKMLENTSIVVQNKAQQLITAIKLDLDISTKAGKESIELVSLMKRYTIDVIGEMAFGVDFQALSPTERKFGGFSFSDLADAQINGINSRFIYPEILWGIPFPVFKKEKETAVIIKSMFDGVLEQTKQNLAVGDESMNLPALILKARDSDSSGHVANDIYPTSEVLGECFSVWGAGHDTTTYTCVHIIKQLAIHQDQQDKLRREVNELDESLGGNPPSFSQICRCTYLSAVIKETQRLYPVAPFFLRESVEETKILGKVIPKNATIMVNVYGIQTSEEYFTDPMAFKPERWIEDPNLPFLTFGMGKRSCFGKKLALLEIKMMLYFMVKNFRIEDDSAINPHICELNFGYVPKGKKMFAQISPL